MTLSNVNFYTARIAPICTYINHFRRTHKSQFWAAVARIEAENAGTINAGRATAFAMVCDKIFFAYSRAKRSGHSLSTAAVHASVRLKNHTKHALAA